MSAPGTRSRRLASPILMARLGHWATIETQGSGAIVAVLENDSLSLGKFGSAAARSLRDLRAGVPLTEFAPDGKRSDKEVGLLVRRLAGHGLLEYGIVRSGSDARDLVIVEPQVLGYWPQTPPLQDTEPLILSRFAYLRRRGNEMVLESPLSKALFRICDPKLASLVAMLSTPQAIKDLRQQDGFPGVEFFSLLLDCQIAFKSDRRADSNARLAEGDQDLALWDFHDLLFHARSTEGRHANPVGGVYPNAGLIAPLPAVRPAWPGKKIDLKTSLDEAPKSGGQVAELLRDRHSTRSFNDGKPITLAELSRFLDGAARIVRRQPGTLALVENEDALDDPRPYPSAGGNWELELYLTVNLCAGLPRGFYHYDASAHAMVPIEVPASATRTVLMSAAQAMGVEAAPQILITIAARFGRVSWKYSSIAYALILKDAGVLTQTLYLMAEGMGLGGCAIGIANVDQFEKMTGIGLHIEGPVGQFALGRPR